MAPSSGSNSTLKSSIKSVSIRVDYSLTLKMEAIMSLNVYQTARRHM
jgi:hypothetical protein